MKNHIKQMLAYAFGAFFVLSGSAAGQDATRPWMEPSQGSIRDTVPVQGGMQDTLRGSIRDTVHGGTLDTTFDRMQDKTGRAVDSVQRGLETATDSIGGAFRDASPDSLQELPGESVEPDNTGINKRDRNDEEATADDQGQSSADIEITRKIRRAIMDDDSLSTYAKNIKIITKDGMVTLKGPVRTYQEKSAIEAKAATVAGTGKIKNQIEIKATDRPSED